MQLSIFIATKVPEKWDKEYKSEECVTSLMMAVQSNTVDIFISSFTSPSMNNSRVLVRTLTGPDDCSTLPLAPDTSHLWGKEHKTDKTWNVEVFFIKSVHKLQTTLIWKEIMDEMDHPGFCVKDRAGLSLMMKAMTWGLQTQGWQSLLPMDLFYRLWKKTEGQLSLFQQILRHPDMFCFAEKQCQTPATEILEVQPDVATWHSQDLIETWCNLADNGLSMQEWLGNMFKAFLAPHPDPGVILGYAWHSQSSPIKPILMVSMADWYLKAEHYLQVQVIVNCEASKRYC